MRVRLRVFVALFLILIIASCSTQNNTLLTRTYHQVTAKYNIYFNGRESFRAGVRRIEQQFIYDYNKILPVFLYGDADLARSVESQMDRAVDKASKVISKKSITADPKERGGFFGGGDEEFFQQNEYNKWVRESYLLAGKAHFYKHDFLPATQAFLFINREYGNNPIRYEAQIWLGRTYTEIGRYNEARLLFEEMLGDASFPGSLEAELYSTIAHFHLVQDQFEQAITNLEIAIERLKDKDRSVRYTYILAQLHERAGNLAASSDYYSKVISMNPDYEMVFNARINLAGVFQTGRGDASSMISDLEKMLRDEKNRDYQDQIYYALGNIYLRSNDEENAIKHYTLSASAPGTNPSQKSVTYLAIADIFFAKPDYVRAQAYYDSAVVNMNPGFPDMEEITVKRDMLTRLVTNLNQYRLEDSVQFLAALSESERNSAIDDIIAKVRQEEAEEREREMLARQTPQYRTARTAQSARQQAERTGGGSWYFYNPSAVTFGQNEFESLWGERRLEDNWRRSNRQVISQDQFAVLGDENTEPEEGSEEATDTQSRDHYLRDIPLTEEAMEASRRRLEEALFNVGGIFNDDFKDYDRSVEAYEELVRRYPQGILRLPAMYELHQVHLLRNDNRASEYYKNLIIDEYPDTPYASVLTNPNYYREFEEKEKASEYYYEETFELFRENRFDQVIERADHALAAWPESPLVPRFEYLKTLSYGSRGNMAQFRAMLTGYIEAYPQTEMADNARQFLAYLEDDYPETVQQVDVAVIQELYRPDQEGEHYFTLIIDNRQDLINRMVFNIINFNVDHFARMNLNVTSQAFSTNYQLLRVEGLPDIPSAIDYFNQFNESEEVFAETDRRDFPVFIISP
jgi:tetratricopeptide (TPR) repeat protein